MDWHRALQHGVGSFGVHHVQNAVNDLVTPGPKNGGAQDFLVVGIDQHLHEALGLALFDSAADASHRASADQCAFPAASYLLLRQTGSAERRVSVKRVRGDAVAEPAGVVVEQIRRDDLEIVIGGVRKRASAVAVAERPDPRYIGTQLVVDHNVTVLVLNYAGPIETEIVGVGPSAHGHQQV